MNKYLIIILVIINLMVFSCKTEEHQFPLDKRFWDTQDYRSASLELNYGYESDEKLPTLEDPTTRLIVEKLTDHQNYIIVLDDKELGLKHKNGVASEFFKQWKDMQDIYQARDVQDKYLYDIELLKVWQFGLGLQLKYFKLGNENIIASSDDPNSTRVKNNLNSNIEAIIGNFNIYIDEINNENAFSENGKQLLAEGIDIYFTKLIALFPDANYKDLERKINLMHKKCKSNEIKNSLSNINDLIESKKTIK